MPTLFFLFFMFSHVARLRFALSFLLHIVFTSPIGVSFIVLYNSFSYDDKLAPSNLVKSILMKRK